MTEQPRGDEQAGAAQSGPGPVGDLSYLAVTAMPSLEWVLGELADVYLERPDEKIRCPLPDHDDSTPSFNLWAEDEDGVPQRWGCFGCGRNGTVTDLIELLRGCSPAEALEIAGRLAQTEPPRESRPRVQREIADFAQLYAAYQMAFDTPDFDVFQKFMHGKGMSGEALETYVSDVWGWTANDGRLVMPHRAADGTITGLKYRAGDRRWNEEGSAFPALYGAWQDTDARGTVLLCEGESDTVWAAWNLRDRDDIRVLGLPSGAGQVVRSEWMEQLHERALVLAFDADEAGIRAARMWCSARNDATLIRLPEGEDVLSSNIPVPELLERAALPRRSLNKVGIEDGVFVYWKKEGKGDDAETVSIPLGDFAFRPVRELLTENGPAWEVVIEGRQDVDLIHSTDFESTTTFIRWANAHGVAWLGGQPSGVQAVHNWIGAESAFMPVEQAVTKAGRVSTSVGRVGRSYVWPDHCVGRDRLRYTPPQMGDVTLKDKLRIEPGPFEPLALRALEQLNDPGTMAIMLGWLCATLLRGDRTPAPPMFVEGESGAGKTQLVSTFLNAFGYHTELNLTSTTPFSVESLIGSTVGFPVWFDEYRGGAREDAILRLRQLMRDAYNGHSSMKGGQDRRNLSTLGTISTLSGIVVSGEMGVHETSLRDRLVVIELDPSAKQRAPYEWLRADPERTRGLGYALLEFLIARDDSTFLVSRGIAEANLAGSDVPERFRDTMGFVQLGWQAWLEFRWANGLRDELPTPPNYALLASQRNLSEDPWLEALKACSGVASRDKAGVIVVSEEQDRFTGEKSGALRVYTNDVVQIAPSYGIIVPGGTKELVKWLKARFTVTPSRDEAGRRCQLVEGLTLGD